MKYYSYKLLDSEPTKTKALTMAKRYRNVGHKARVKKINDKKYGIEVALKKYKR